jgi:hypothetical protein
MLIKIPLDKGKYKVKLSFLIKISPGNFHKFIPNKLNKYIRKPIKINKDQIIIKYLAIWFSYL